MKLFKVVEVIDGEFIQVDKWHHTIYSGSLVKVQGYVIPKDVPEEDYIFFHQFVRRKLKVLLDGELVSLVEAVDIEAGEGEGNDILHCSVLLEGIDISIYFTALQHINNPMIPESNVFTKIINGISKSYRAFKHVIFKSYNLTN